MSGVALARFRVQCAKLGSFSHSVVSSSCFWSPWRSKAITVPCAINHIVIIQSDRWDISELSRQSFPDVFPWVSPWSSKKNKKILRRWLGNASRNRYAIGSALAIQRGMIPRNAIWYRYVARARSSSVDFSSCEEALVLPELKLCTLSRWRSMMNKVRPVPFARAISLSRFSSGTHETPMNKLT